MAATSARDDRPRPEKPLRGDAAWRAELKEIATRNDAARAAGARRRAAKQAESDAEAARLERREAQALRDR
jgi:hypothetical protein